MAQEKVGAVAEKRGGRKSASELEAAPGENLGRSLVELRRVMERVAGIAEKALGSEEGAKLRELVDQGSLRPEVERIAKKLNGLSEKEFSLLEGMIEGQLNMLAKLRA